MKKSYSKENWISLVTRTWWILLWTCTKIYILMRFHMVSWSFKNDSWFTAFLSKNDDELLLFDLWLLFNSMNNACRLSHLLRAFAGTAFCGKILTVRFLMYVNFMNWIYAERVCFCGITNFIRILPTFFMSPHCFKSSKLDSFALL